MGEDDDETPLAERQPKLDHAKAAGAPIESHLCPKATHCRDCRNVGDVGHLRIGNLFAQSFKRPIAN